MPLIRCIEPDLPSMIAYIVARAREQQITLNRTKLVKLLYLIDVECVRARRETVTGLDWVFYHYGPYAFELIDTLEAMEGSALIAQKWHDTVLYRSAPDGPDGEDWLTGTRRTVDTVISRYASLDLNELLDYVYFHTGPMADAQRGCLLDMSRARADTTPRRSVPLGPPARPRDVEDRLARWRSRTAQRLTPVSLDPPGAFLDDPRNDLAGEGVRGQLHVPEGSEL
jgi:hypothetical protein